MSLMEGLWAARRGLAAQTTRLAVISQNVANADNPDYSRQRIEEVAVPAPWPAGGVAGKGGPAVGGGLSVIAIRREQATWIEARLRQAAGEAAGAKAQQETLTALQEAWGEPGEAGGLSQLISEWTAAINDWSGHPTDAGVKRVVVERSEDLAAGLRRLAGLVTQARQDQNAGLESDVQRVNELLHQLAATNRAVVAGEAGSEATGQVRVANDARDRRDALLRELAQYAPFRVVANPQDQARDGAFRLELAGAVLVDGDQLLGEFKLPPAPAGGQDPAARKLEWSSLPGQPPAQAELTAADLGNSGRWAARLELRDQVLAGGSDSLQRRLDQLAQDLADGINGIQGDPPLFLGAGGQAGSVKAGDIHVSGAAAGDPRDFFADLGLLNPGVGNEKVLTWLSWITPQQPGGSAPWTQRYGELVADLGAQVQRSEGLASTASLRQENLQALRQARSGVQSDEEMADLLTAQRAYTAAVRVISTLDQALGEVIDRMGSR